MNLIKENYELMFTSYPDVVNIQQLKNMLGIGITLAYRLVKKGFIINGSFEDDLVFNSTLGDIVMCRPDAPHNSWHNLPRGKDMSIKNLEKFYLSVKNQGTPDSILLCFQHPSIFFTNKFVERYNISGGVNILLLWNEAIVLEFVGSGFDVGDITRGQITPHQIYRIPWNSVKKYCDKLVSSYQIDRVDDEQYQLSRKSRISFLQTQGYESTILENSIPMYYSPLKPTIFNIVWTKCVLPVVRNHTLFPAQQPVTILINLYNDIPHVFEIWESTK